MICISIAGWSSLEARRAHNPKAAGSNPAPAISVCAMEAHLLKSIISIKYESAFFHHLLLFPHTGMISCIGLFSLYDTGI